MSRNKYYGGRVLRIAIGIMMLGLLLTGGAGAATLTVDDSGGADYMRIQDAINAADTGDTILVYSGTYPEIVNVNKQLILKGIDTGAGKPLIDAELIGHAINITINGVLLEGFNVTNAKTGGNTGIFLNSDNNIIKNNECLNNYMGIKLINSSNNVLSNNNLASHTIGIYLTQSNNNILISNNVSENAIGVSMAYSSNNTFSNNKVISSLTSGINLDHSNSNTLSGNTVNSSRDHDIVLSMSENNRIYHNNLMSFNIQAVDSHSNGNLWDNDYPSGGNYYRNYYDGVDLKNGKEQDQVGSDGIGDTPQLISNGAGLIIAQDRYPLMKPWGTTASIPKTLLDIYASAQYNPDSKKLNISAFAFSRISGKVIFGTAGYVINPVGLKGNLVYNPASESWESRNINLNSLNVGDYNINITICSGSECGYDEAEFSIADKYGSLTGYLIDGTLSNESHKVTISGVEILLYDSNNYFSSNPVPIAANITNINGKYIFTRVPVGYYVVNVTVNDRRSLPASIEVRGNSVNDINVYANFLDILYPNMKQLSNSYVNIMEYDTRLMAEISGRFHEDIAHDIEAYDVVLFSLNIWGNPSFSPSWLTKYHKMYGNEYIVLFTKYVIEEMAKEGLVQGVLWYNSIESEDLPKYVLNMDSGRSENDLKNTDYYINVADLINNKNKNFEKDASNIGLMDEFDINDAQKVILDQRIQIVEIINTGYWNVIVPPYPEDNANFLSMRDTYGSYMEMVVAADKFKWKSRGVKSAIIISKFISMTTPAGATILVLNSVLDEVWTTTSAAAEIRYKNKIGETGALSFASWVTDLSKLPQSYELVSDFLKAEAKAPYYLNKNNDFSTVVNYESSTLKDVTTREKPISIIAEKKHLWSFDKDMDGEITINIKNTGNIESTYRVFSQGVVDKQNFWASINVPFLNIGANVGKIPMTVSNDFADAKLAPNGQTSMTMKFKGYYFLWNNYILHSLILRVFSGPFEIDKKQYFYRVVDPVNDVVNSRTSEGYLSVANDSRYLPSITKILTDNLTSGNPIIQKIFSTDNNTSSLEINMLYSFGTPVDLHVYDKEGNHVGFNNLTGKDEIGFSALYYGNSQNPEKIIIPNAANKTYTIQAVLGYSDYPTTSQITIYALEIPERPPILTVYPMHIEELASQNQTIPINLFIAESGGQHPITNITIKISNISGEYGTNLSTYISEEVKNWTLPANSLANVTYLLNISKNTSEGNYSGLLTVDSDVGQFLINVTIYVTSKSDLSAYIILNQNASKELMNISVVVSNKGFSNVSNAKFSLLIDNISVENRSIALETNKIETMYFNWTTSSGQHLIKVIVDPDNQIDEWNEENNVFELIYNIVSPDIMPPASISNLININYFKTHLNFTWINPSDPDFNHTEVYLNGTFITNILAPQNYYNATGLLPDTSYQLSTRTVDTSGNINQTWVNHTVTTNLSGQTKGDFNNNGRVDIGDVAKVAYMVVGEVAEDIGADFNGNGRVDIGDAAKIAYYLVGKVGEL